MSALNDSIRRLFPPQILEPPLVSRNAQYDNGLLNRRTALSLHGNPPARMTSHSSANKLPAMCDLGFQHFHETLGVSCRPQYPAQFGSAFSPAQDLKHSQSLHGSEISAGSASGATTEPAFAKLLAAGCDMKSVLEAMDENLSCEEILELFRVDLARPAMPEEPIPDPDYKPRPSTVTGKPPADPKHSKKETERRAQHKHYLDLSEIKIPDFFLKLCGWEEPRGSEIKRTPRTKSSILQAGCLYVWFLSVPVVRCLQNLRRKTNYLEDKVKRLEAENHKLRSATYHSDPHPASSPKKRKISRQSFDAQDGPVRLAFDDNMENSLPDIDSIRDQSKDDHTSTQMYQLGLSSAHSLPSGTASCWDSMSSGSSWDQPSPYSTADSHRS